MVKVVFILKCPSRAAYVRTNCNMVEKIAVFRENMIKARVHLLDVIKQFKARTANRY